MTTWYESDNPNGFVTGKTFSIDQPFVTVMTAGAGGDSLGHWNMRIDDMPDAIAGLPAPADKPPYRVPPMAEVAAIAPCGLMVATFFAGCGGSSLGYRMAGYRVLYANEFVPAAQESYRANMAPWTHLDPRDVRDVTAEEVLAACKLSVGEVDLVDGSPPCQAFSTAGKRSAGWGSDKKYEHGAKQKNEDMFFEYVRLLDGIKPRAFVAENVSGLVKGVAKGYFIEILRRLKACGYRVEARLLDAQWLGVPQQRQRIIFVGVREDLELDPAFPSPLQYRYSVREAIPWITSSRVTQGSGNGHSSARGEVDDLACAAPTIITKANQFDVAVEGATGFDGHAERSIDDPMATVSAGRPVRLLPPSRTRPGAYAVQQVDPSLPCPTVTCASPGNDLAVSTYAGPQSADEPAPTLLTHGREATRSEMMIERGASIDGYAIGREWDRTPQGGSSKRYLNLKRAGTDKPSQSTVSVTHPTEKRKFTIAELRRICSFPDDFVLTGSYAQQWERLGNSVPPLMMRAIAEAVRDRVLLPARAAARKAARRPRSPGRSTSAISRRGAAPRPRKPRERPGAPSAG